MGATPARPQQPPLHLGVSLPTSGPFATAEHIFAVAERAEELGFDDVWVNDHYTFPRERLRSFPIGSVEACTNQDPNFFESLAALATVGGRCRRIGIAVHALTLPVREVRLFAKQVTTIQELLGQRLTIAPGIGGEETFQVMDIPRSERGRRMDEALEALTVLIGSEPPVSFAGRFARFRDVTFHPRAQSLRLWITGEGEFALRRVVRWGSGWFSSVALVERFSENLARLEELAREAGRDPAEIERATDIRICIADSMEEAVAIARETLEQRYGTIEDARRYAAFGTEDNVLEHLLARIRGGLSYIELRFICHAPRAHLEMLDRVAAEVVPRLRAATS
jgi:alkanesulfonate monooxygenase SsuD/methylene tetrahydromethanopterin reductase-like flavin-dependent oxidoreductase (luciferase family)